MASKPARNPALEQRIVDAPDDVAPRMVYGDWLQAAGDPLGEWVARSGDDAYLAEHARDLLGRADELAAWIGWKSGFIDELRLHRAPDPVRRLDALLARPIARFVRRVAIGSMAYVDRLVASIARANLPLLGEALVVDGGSDHRATDRGLDLDPLASIPTLRELALYGGTIERAMPQLRALTIAVPSTAVPWVVRGGCPNVESLTLDCRTTPAPLAPILAALGKLRTVRVIGAPREVVDAQLASAIGRIERVETGESLEAWIVDRVKAGGRDEVALLPFAGAHLANAGERLLRGGRPREAVPLLDAAITMPNPGNARRASIVAALAHEQAGLFERAIAVAERELRRFPQEMMFHAIRLDALRGRGDVAAGLARVPDALAALDAQRSIFEGAASACVLACLRVLAATNRRDEALALATRTAPLGGDEARAIVAALT